MSSIVGAFQTARSPGQPATEMEATEMNAIIDEAFSGVSWSTHFSANGTLIPKGWASSVPSWERCSLINYSKSNCLATEGTFLCKETSEETLDVVDKLGLSECFHLQGSKMVKTLAAAERTPLCQAVDAFLEAMAQLTKKYAAGPSFANAATVMWTNDSFHGLPPNTSVWKNGGNNPSWRAGGITVDYKVPTAMNTAIFHDLGEPWGVGNPNNAWAICDISRTVLQQSANQVGTSTCAPTSWLAAVSNAAPALALKFALEIFWTGTLRQLPRKPCMKGLYDLQPGLVPYGQPGFKDKCLKAGGNEGDCANAVGLPLNPVGLEFYWTQTLYSSYYAQYTCDQGYHLNWEGNVKDWKTIKDWQGADFNLGEYWCSSLMGPFSDTSDPKTCKAQVNTMGCKAYFGDDITKCLNWGLFPILYR